MCLRSALWCSSVPLSPGAQLVLLAHQFSDVTLFVEMIEIIDDVIRAKSCTVSSKVPGQNLCMVWKRGVHGISLVVSTSYAWSTITLSLPAKMLCSAMRLLSARRVKSDKPHVHITKAIEHAIIAHIPRWGTRVSDLSGRPSLLCTTYSKPRCH